MACRVGGMFAPQGQPVHNPASSKGKPLHPLTEALQMFNYSGIKVCSIMSTQVVTALLRWQRCHSHLLPQIKSDLGKG